MQDGHALESVMRDRRTNSFVSWMLVLFLALIAVSSLPVDPLWSVFVSFLVALAVVPPVRYSDPGTMLPWEVLVLAVLPVLGTVLDLGFLTTDLSNYFAVSAVALILAIEIHLFTPVSFSPGFAVGFVVVATLATAGTWAIVEWLSDVYLGTRLIESEEELMVRFTAATAAGFLAGVVFTAYFQRERRMWLKRYREGELSLASRTSEGDEG